METLLIALVAFIVFLSALWRIIARPAPPQPSPEFLLAVKELQQAQQVSCKNADEERMVRGIVRRTLETNRQAWLEQEGGDPDKMELS